MTEADARAFVVSMADTGTKPELTASEITRCLNLARVADRDGRAPSDPLWVPTWQIARAVAAAWDMKAAKAAARFDYSDVSGRYSRSQVVKECREQARDWRRKLFGWVRL